MPVDFPSTTLLSSLAGFAYFGLIMAFVLMVIMKRRPVGVTLSWLLLLIGLPVVGILLFLMFGHQRLGSKRLVRADTLNPGYNDWHAHLRKILPEQTPPPCGSHNRVYNLTEHTTNIPALSDALTLTPAAFRRKASGPRRKLLLPTASSSIRQATPRLAAASSAAMI